MTLWSFYFLSKLFLYYRGHIQFHALFNFLLVVYWLLPWAVQKTNNDIKLAVSVRRAHAGLGVILAFLVIWRDSYFPPIMTAVNFVVDSTARPTLSYTVDFILGYWSPVEVSVLVGLLLFSFWAHRRKFKMAPVVTVLMLIPAVNTYLKRAPTAGGSESEFYSAQVSGKQTVRFDSLKSNAVPFDIVILQVCSLSWDDLEHVGLDKHPFFSEFDALFTQFNTVTSYSTPSALRLLRSNCGQSHHAALYDGVPDDCFLMESLRHAGYSTQTVFNHRGELSTKMAEESARLGKADAPMNLGTASPEATNFDATPIFNNFQTLSEWWKGRLTSGAERSAVYYNTVSLHTGSHFLNDPVWWKRDSIDKYKEALNRTLSDFSRFFSVIESSGRDVLVVVVSEHGAALVGSAIQARDLRDIPLPKITSVPMGVRFFSRGRGKPTTKRFDKRITYRSISLLLNDVLKRRTSRDIDPLTEETFSRLPEVPYFAENESAATTIQGGELFYRGQDKVWKNLPKDLIPAVAVQSDRK